MDTDPGWLALSLVSGVGAKTFHRLIRRFGSPENVFKAPRRHLEQVPGLTKRTIDAIRSFPREEAAAKEMARLSGLDIHVVRWGAKEYPDYLANIADPPALIYVKGNLIQEDERAVAVVGARRASAYGLAVCKKLTRDLAWQGWTVVSGMARGIDSAAHQGALAGGGRTLAVLGTGLDVIYPAENNELYHRIAASGAVISEFALGTPPEPGNFPVRNRLISGLALGVVVVEATAKSGSLITARLALEQGRQVFAVPGPVDRQGVAGPHRLIKEGAKLVERAEDIVEELLPMVSHRPEVGMVETEATLPGPDPILDENEQKVWDILGMEPLHMDDIARQLDFSLPQTAEHLLRLEIKGLVKQLPGTFFVRDFSD
ncbi:MAG: DNA-processing protein DprA [Deltaproteobacteria bacterium]|nr:MAG: DNA-processing protein DprA [Deltaproteobacteria bacterium]